MKTLLIPKAVSEQARWQQALAECPIKLSWVDPWQIERCPQDGVVRNQWLNLDLNSGVICVSPTAAQALTDALDEYWPMPPERVHWLCNGPRTASVLQAGGLSPVYPQTGHTAEDVLALPQARVKSGDKWLIVKGEGGRLTLAQTLTERGAQVTELAVYKRSVDECALDDMAAQAAGTDALWLSSEFLGQQLLEHSPDLWRSWSGTWWVSSTRLQDWCRQQGLESVEVAPGATVQALKELIHVSAHAESENR